MKISAYGYTNRGGRPHNEDRICWAAEEGGGVFVVADGLGGHSRGEVASALAAAAVFRGCREREEMTREAMEEVFQKANEAVLEGQKTPGQEEMRTTAVALDLRGGRAVWGHAGDSRLYRFSSGGLAFVTGDHSVTYKTCLAGEISAMDVYHDDDRSSLLRVLGKPGARGDTGAAALQSGDAFLLCTDGFWEYVYQEEMLADWLKSTTPEQWVELMLLRHIRRTPPGNDNFSVIAVFVEEEL